MHDGTVVDGLTFPEGVRWHDDALWLSDMHGHRVLRIGADGAQRLVAEVPECPSGLGFMPDGRLLIVSMHDRRLLSVGADGVVSEHAHLAGLAPWHLNDLAVDASGRAYVGNFGDASAPPEPAAPTVLIAVEPNGEARVVADDLLFPNGIAISADGGTLIVAETRSVPGRLTAFAVEPDGDLSARRTLVEFGPGELPDGISLDRDGRIWVAMPFSGEVVRVTPDGEVDARIEVESPYAVAVGGPDGDELFVCTAPTWVPEEAARLRAGSVWRLPIP